MDKEKFLNSGLMELYILGLASPAEQEIVMDYALAYPDIQETLNLSIEALEEYAKAHSVMPPKNLKEQIMTDLGEAQGKKNTPLTIGNQATSSFNTLAVFLGIGMLISSITAFVFFQKNQHGAQQYKDLQTEYAVFKTACETRNEAERAIALENDFLKNKHTAIVNLKGTAVSPTSKAFIFWNENKKESYLKIASLPNPPEGFQYQLWADIDEKMVDMGVFDLEENTLIKVPFMERAISLNVTLEKIGGALHPTVERLYISGLL